MKLITMLITCLLIAACSSQTSSVTAAECGDRGSGGDGCISDQDGSMAVSLRSRRYGGPSCGDRIKADEVMMIDLSTPEGQAQLEQAGSYVLLTESMISIRSKGSRVQTVKAATDSAASRGCDLLLTGSVEEERTRTAGSGALNTNANGRYGAPVGMKKYLLVRMAKLQE